MRGVQGLDVRDGIVSRYDVLVQEDSQAGPEDISGKPANPRHGTPTVKRRGSESHLTQAGSNIVGLHNQMIDDEYWFFGSGGFEADDYRMDYTPTGHGAPFPKGILSGPAPSEGPDDIQFQRIQSYEIHAVRSNAGTKRLTILPPLNDEWLEINNTTPGHTDLQPLGSRQAMSTGFMYATRDRTHSFARQNEYGFDSAHAHRRWAVSPIPGNFMWLKPGGRPLIKTMPSPARPAVGPDSPFAGQDIGRGFGIVGAILQNTPPEYAPPPSPLLAKTPGRITEPAPVDWY